MGVVAGLAQLAVDTRGEADLLDRRLSNDTPNPGGGDNCSWCFLGRRHLVLQEKQRAANRTSSVCTRWPKKENDFLAILKLATKQYILQLDHGPTIGPAAPMGDCRHGGLNTSESYV